ncbi:1408_t:CDS:2 [Ambispora leptoticha]|uniref:1408_t:CDS:1 n=1 Tax=Ambispora leptoticha TaxID=144679 RepID=A0A9N9HDU3_9GLOM|nr:1408_t:CDS:2 [Ambispora leptoticha]
MSSLTRPNGIDNTGEEGFKKRQMGPNNSTIVVSVRRQFLTKTHLIWKKSQAVLSRVFECLMTINVQVIGEGQRTTFMIRNIPNNYNQRMLLETLDETHNSQYDFFYLTPFLIIYNNSLFQKDSAVLSFAKLGLERGGVSSTPRYSRQESLVEKFRNSSVMGELPEYHPKIFFSSGALCNQKQPSPEPKKTIKRK